MSVCCENVCVCVCVYVCLYVCFFYRLVVCFPLFVCYLLVTDCYCV